MTAARKIGAWEEALYATINEWLDKPFVWGQRDCTLLGVECFDAMTGEDNARAIRGKWNSRKSAWAYARRNNLALERWLRDRGCVDVPRGAEAAGDFWIMERQLAHQKLWHSVSVCLERTTAVMTEEHGLVLVETRSLVEPRAILRIPG
jgi:hypothetical protein